MVDRRELEDVKRLMSERDHWQLMNDEARYNTLLGLADAVPSLVNQVEENDRRLYSTQEVARICTDANKNMVEEVRRLTASLQSANLQVESFKTLERAARLMVKHQQDKHEFSTCCRDVTPSVAYILQSALDELDEARPVAENRVELSGNSGQFAICGWCAGTGKEERTTATCPKCHGAGGFNRVELSSDAKELEKRFCVKCGAKNPEGKAHPYSCIGKGDAAHPAEPHDCVGVRFCAVCNVRLDE